MPSKTKIIGVEWNFAGAWAEAFRCLPEKPLVRRERIFASELSGSFRERYLKMYAHPYSNPVNFRSRAKMMAGKFFEDIAWIVLGGTGLLQERQVKCMVEIPGMLPVSGKCDFLAGGVIDWDKAYHEAETIKKIFSFARSETSEFVAHLTDKILPHFKNLFLYSPAMQYKIEIKSLSGFVFKHVQRNNRPRRGHDFQTLHYLISDKSIPKGYLQYISREDCMLHDIFIDRTPKLLKAYKEDVATMTQYHDLGKKNYLKHIPPPDKELIFEEASFNFVKSNLVEYSKYLTFTHGYKNIDEFKERWDKSLSRWNRAFKRVVKGENITANNLEAIKEAKKEFPEFDKYVAKAKAAGAFDKPEIESDDE